MTAFAIAVFTLQQQLVTEPCASESAGSDQAAHNRTTYTQIGSAVMRSLYISDGD